MPRTTWQTVTCVPGINEAAMQSFAMAADDKLDPAIAEDALFNYGKLQYELGGGAFNGAINVLTRYVGQYPDSPRVDEARSLLIAAYYNSNDYDAAYRAIKSLPDTGCRHPCRIAKDHLFPRSGGVQRR